MKHLLPPAFAVALSTAGTSLGCHLVGMPPHDLKIAVSLAFAVSLFVAFGAVLLAGRRAPPPAGVDALRHP